MNQFDTTASQSPAQPQIHHNLLPRKPESSTRVLGTRLITSNPSVAREQAFPNFFVPIFGAPREMETYIAENPESVIEYSDMCCSSLEIQQECDLPDL